MVLTAERRFSIHTGGPMKNLRFAFFGAGWFARFQLGAWCEIKGAKCAAIYNRTRSKAEQLAREFNVPKTYDDPEELLKKENVDFVDIATNPFTLSRFVHLAAKYKVPVICQKPMAPSVAVAEKMVNVCRKARIPFYVHENWRWQAPIRRLKRELDKGAIGKVFRAHISRVSGYPVFKYEPTLPELQKFVISDTGTHLLDTARFLFGEASALYCQLSGARPYQRRRRGHHYDENG
jgi:predicted dehydrogenase